MTTHVVSENGSYAWDYRPYAREPYCQDHQLSFPSKNDLAIEMDKALPVDEDEVVYVLMEVH